MSDRESESLAERLKEVEERFEREMRMRGFQPDQLEHLAFTGTLAKLYNEREALREALKSSQSDDSKPNERS